MVLPTNEHNVPETPMNSGASTDAEPPEFPMNLKDFPVTSEPMQIDDYYHRVLAFAALYKDYKDYARTLTKKLLEDGKSPTEILQMALDAKDKRVLKSFTRAVNKKCYAKKPLWTYERSLALYILGAMAIDYPGLSDDLFKVGGDPSNLHITIDTVAAALINGMHVLGCPDHLSLAQILDYASSWASAHRKADSE